MKEMNQEDVRPLAFQLARELNTQEIEAISGGNGFSVPGWNPRENGPGGYPDNHH
jgi:hypothetical protein